MTTSDFAEASAIRTRSQPQTFDAKIPDGWQQGKGAFGGGCEDGWLGMAIKEAADGCAGAGFDWDG